MEDIAKELRNISDQIGENIYDSMMDGLEAQDRLKARADVIREKVDEAKQENADELKARMDSLNSELRNFVANTKRWQNFLHLHHAVFYVHSLR